MSGPYLFSYSSKNTLNRLIFDSNKRRREGLDNASVSSAQPVSHLTPKKSASSSLPGRKTPRRLSHNNFCNDADEVQQILTSSPIASVNDAYMRQNESTLVSPGGRDTLQAGRHIADGLLASPPTESAEVIFDDCIVQLKTCNIQLKSKYAETSRELSHLHQKYEEISQRLLTAEAELKESRQISTSALVEVKAKEAEKKSLDNLCAETKSQLVTLLQENDRLKAELGPVKVEVERLRTAFDSFKTRFTKLSESVATVGSGLRELGQAHTSSREQLHLVRMEFEDTKRQAKSGLKALQPILDDDGTLARSQEMKALLSDLQESLVSSHQVTDILRAKILHQASQLADARERVKELEEQSLTKISIATEDNKQHITLLADMGKNLEEFAAKLIVREKEALDALLASASLEANVETLSKEIETHATEREENISKLLSLQNTINSRDKEIATLKSDLRALKESKEDLRVLLAEAKKDLAERESAIRAKDPNIEFQLKIEDLTEETNSLRIRLKEAEEKKRISLKDWLVEENELKKRLYESEGVGIALRVSNEQLQANLLSTRAELTTLVVEHQGYREEVRAATDEVPKLQERLDTQGLELSRSKEDHNELNLQYHELEVRMEEKDRVLQAQEMRASVAESSLSWAKEQFVSANLKNKDLEARITASSREISLAKENAEQAVSSVLNDYRSQLTILQKKNLQLESVNAQATGRSEKLVELYRTGQLTDAEKLFVSHIMSETEAAQEEGIVKKDHELRLGEMSLRDAKARLETAQETIRRLLAEKNGRGNGGDESMVDLGAPSRANRRVAESLTPDAMDDVSEDDIPLAELHKGAESVIKLGIKRSRSPSPLRLQEELPKRSKQKAPVEAVPKKPKGKKKK